MQTSLWHQFIIWCRTHAMTVVFGAYIVFSNFVSTMPTPTSTDSKLYTWLYGFLNLLASNLGKFKEQQKNGADVKKS